MQRANATLIGESFVALQLVDVQALDNADYVRVLVVSCGCGCALCGGRVFMTKPEIIKKLQASDLRAVSQKAGISYKRLLQVMGGDATKVELSTLAKYFSVYG